MKFATAPAPHVKPPRTVAQVMSHVLYALVPGTIAHVWFFGPGILFNMLAALAFAVSFEALMLRLRGRPLSIHLADFSAPVTAVLLAFALPPLLPWWITAVGVMFAIVFAKHLYGGLGHNPFNPAMVGYVVLLVAFPLEMGFWPAPALSSAGLSAPDFQTTLTFFLTGDLPPTLSLDGISGATPLDRLQTGLAQMMTMGEMQTEAMMSGLGGHGWTIINLAVALGGAWLLITGVIRWHIPVAVLVSVFVTAAMFHVIDADLHASALFHLFAGNAMLGAFFIATDPVSAATSNRGRLIYGAGIGILTYVIRTFGSYPDGLGFAVLLMNGAVPAIDHLTRPRTYGHD